MLIIATPRLGTTIRKTSFLAAKHAATNIKKAFIQTFHTRFDVENKIPPPSRSKVMNNIQNIQATTLKLEAPPISYQASIGSGREKLEQKLKGVPEKLTLPRSGASALAGGVGYANEHSPSQELSMDCLTCENLINCRHRRSKTVEAQVGGFQTSKCHFAQKLSTNKTAAS
jgi:hypothetical protein